MPTISQNRLNALLAAEATCQQMRSDIAGIGGVTQKTVDYMFRWMRLSGKSVYDTPKPLRAIWCPDCKRRHKPSSCNS